MAEEQKHYFVNWIDGMKINKEHFIGSENAVIQRQHMMGKFLVNPYNFGLLQGDYGKSNLDISFEMDNHKRLNITINHCLAITSGGLFIDIDTSIPELSGFEINLDEEFQNLESNTNEFYIVLKINPYKRVPAGNADPNESPPRHPFAIDEYSVHIVSVEQMNKAGFGDYFQVIGKIVLKDNIPEIDKDYIPPCSRVSSDERLLEINDKLVEFFSKMEVNIMEIIRKIHTKQQKSPLATSVMHLADKLAAFHGLHITRQRLFLKHMPPVTLFEAISQFARLQSNVVNSQAPDRKEEMINYISDWCNLKQGELEKMFLEIVNYSYNHFEIASVMKKMITFIDTMAVMFDTLSRLEYIGKRKDTQIYIKEEVKPKRSFLADD